MGIIGAIGAINSFGVTKLFSNTLDCFGFHGTFWMYGCVMLVEVIYGFFVLPENKGISLVHTEDKMFQKNEKKVFLTDICWCSKNMNMTTSNSLIRL